MTTRRSRPDEVWDFLYEFVAHAAKAHWDLEEEVVGRPMLFWCLCHMGCVPSYYTAEYANLLRQLANRMGIGWPAVLDLVSGWVGRDPVEEDLLYQQMGQRLRKVYCILRSNPDWYCPHVKHEGRLLLPTWKKQGVDDSIVIIAVPQGTAFLRVTASRRWGPVFPYEWSSSVTGEFGKAQTEYEGRERAEQSVRTYLQCMTEAMGGGDDGQVHDV